MRRGEDNCRVLRGDREGGERVADNGMGRIMPCHSSTHWTTDIAHDNATRCGAAAAAAKVCYVTGPTRQEGRRSSLAAPRKGVKITTTWSEHDERYRVISLQTLDLGNKESPLTGGLYFSKQDGGTSKILVNPPQGDGRACTKWSGTYSQVHNLQRKLQSEVPFIQIQSDHPVLHWTKK